MALIDGDNPPEKPSALPRAKPWLVATELFSPADCDWAIPLDTVSELLRVVLHIWPHASPWLHDSEWPIEYPWLADVPQFWPVESAWLVPQPSLVVCAVPTVSAVP